MLRLLASASKNGRASALGTSSIVAPRLWYKAGIVVRAFQQRVSRRRFLGRTLSVAGAVPATLALQRSTLTGQRSAEAGGQFRLFVAGLAADGSGMPPPTSAAASGLVYVAGSTAKVEQLIGEFDKQANKPTGNLTQSRFGIIGTDLGHSFEHNGRLYFGFGNTIAAGAPDPLGYSDSTDPNSPLQISFVSKAAGTFVPVKVPNIAMGPFDVPTGGLSLDGAMYVLVKTNYGTDGSTYQSMITRYDESTQTYSSVRELSHLPGGHFITTTLRLSQGGLAGLPGPGPYVLIFGSGVPRASNAYLAAVPTGSFTGGENTKYFAGMNGALPTWASTDAAAAPIVVHPTIGDLSVLFIQQLGLWVMIYDSRSPRGVLLRSAPNPWGPWSDPQVLFNPDRDRAYGAFMHDPRIKPDDGLSGPFAGTTNAATTSGGEYAPYLIERFTQLAADALTLHYVMSTWNPYTFVRMRSTLTVLH